MIVVTAAQMQAIDRRTIEEVGIPGRILMENAGRGATRAFLEQIYALGQGPVGVLAGRGNNGGDGFVMARYLAQQEINVTVFLLAEKKRVQGDAAANLALLDALAVPVLELPDIAAFAAQHTRMRHIMYWIDALLGTGLKDEVQGFFREVIAFVRDLKRPILAVDIPSGLNADTGMPCGICFHADVTVTFGHPKIGQMVQPGADLCGRLVLIDIGIPPTIGSTISPCAHLISGSPVAKLLPRRTVEAHKGRTGHLLVFAGSKGKTGAAAMTVMSALRIGAGLVTLAVADSINSIMESLTVEAMTLPLPDGSDREGGWVMPDAFEAIREAARNKQCLALGPGLGTAESTAELVAAVVASIDLPLVIDADGLNIIAGRMALLAARKAPTILTPHPGEMARLCGTTVGHIQRDRVSFARKLAEDHGVYVVLKGARTLVAEPGGQVWINTSGNSGMAAGGMGDVLTGALAGLLAQGCSPVAACCGAVYLHGLAADLLATATSRGFLATDVMKTLPLAIERVLTDPPLPPLAMPIL